jgi:hypothetical protein
MVLADMPPHLAALDPIAALIFAPISANIECTFLYHVLPRIPQPHLKTQFSFWSKQSAHSYVDVHEVLVSREWSVWRKEERN